MLFRVCQNKVSHFQILNDGWNECVWRKYRGSCGLGECQEITPIILIQNFNIPHWKIWSVSLCLVHFQTQHLGSELQRYLLTFCSTVKFSSFVLFWNWVFFQIYRLFYVQQQHFYWLFFPQWTSCYNCHLKYFSIPSYIFIFCYFVNCLCMYIYFLMMT